ncbi:MAG: aconitase family protein [Pirellulales bacterium]
MGFFPVDAETLEFPRCTGRSAEEVELVERYTKEQGLFRTDETPPLSYTQTLRLDLAIIVPSLAGPKRPQDRLPLDKVKTAFRQSLQAPSIKRGYNPDAARWSGAGRPAREIVRRKSVMGRS